MGEKIRIIRHNSMVNWSDFCLIGKVDTIFVRGRHDLLDLIFTNSEFIHYVNSFFSQRMTKFLDQFASKDRMNFVALRTKTIQKHKYNISIISKL
jgi:hypothetical protein